jgi:hypothetical protein
MKTLKKQHKDIESMDASTWCVGQAKTEKPLNIQSILVFFQLINPHNFTIQKKMHSQK